MRYKKIIFHPKNTGNFTTDQYKETQLINRFYKISSEFLISDVSKFVNQIGT